MKKFVVITIILIIIFSVGAYFLNFHDREIYHISNDTSKWGSFADYLNPFVGLINVVLLVYISFELSNIEGKRLEKNILITLRYDKVNEITKILDSLDLNINPTQNNVKKIDPIVSFLRDYFRNNKYLFEKHFNKETSKENIKELFKILFQTKRNLDYALNRNIEIRINCKDWEDNKLRLDSYNRNTGGIRLNDSELKEVNSNIERSKKGMQEAEVQSMIHYTNLFRLRKEYFEQKSFFIDKLNKFILDELKE